MIAPVPSVAPSDDVAVVLQAAGVGALLGASLAARRRARDPDYDAWLLTARWTIAFAIGGVGGVLRHRLGWW